MLDETDKRIISQLTQNCRGSFRELAKKAGMHPATFISRVRKMEKDRIITGYYAKIDFEKAGHSFMAVVELSIQKKLIEVQNKLKNLSGIIGIHDVTGDTDSMLVVACENSSEFNKLIKKIHELPGIERTNTHVILNVIKDSPDFIL